MNSIKTEHPLLDIRIRVRISKGEKRLLGSVFNKRITDFESTR